MITAVILARKGSKRVPGKNKMEIGGRPMVAWAIIEALKSAYIDETAVSSDDEDVLAIANDYSVKAVRRPPYLATDDASPYDGIIDALNNINVSEGHVVLLQPTSPCRIVDDIDHCIRTCLDFNLDAAATAAAGNAVPNGAVYVSTLAWLLGGGSWDENGLHLVPMPLSRSQDVDTLEDFKMAEAALFERAMPGYIG